MLRPNKSKSWTAKRLGMNQSTLSYRLGLLGIGGNKRALAARANMEKDREWLATRDRPSAAAESFRALLALARPPFRRGGDA